MKYDDSNKSKITLGGEGGTTITNVKSALDGAKDEKGKDATSATATGDALKNAANLGDLQKVYNDINTKAENASASHTALTVEGGTSAGTKDEKTKEDVYAGKNILLHESADENGKVTYDLKLAKDISIGKPGKDGEDGKIGIDGRDGHIGLNGSDGITVRGLDGENGTPGKDGVTITGPKGEAGKDGVGHIGLTGPAGTNGIKGADGQPGTSIDITVKNGYDGTDGKDGVKGEKGVDGTSLTRIVYTDGAGEHQVATMEDGLKFKGDDTTVINKKLNNTLDIIGGAKGDLTEGNIGVNNDSGKLKVQLAKDLTGITSISNQATTKVDGKDVTTGAKITLGADGTTTISGGDVNVSGNKITHVGSGIDKDANGKYTVTDQNKGNAANIGDVQNMVNDAKTELISGDNGLNKKANIDASNIGANLKGEDGKTPASDDEKTTNENAWGKAIGTGKIEANNGQLVTGDTVYNEVRPKEDGNYVKTSQTTGANLSALDSKIGKLDETKKYNYIDSKESTSISDNLTKLDTQVKKNADDITNINNSISSLNQNAVKYDDSSKSKISLGGEGGTTITNVKDGSVKKDSTDAVNGGQLWQVDQKVDTNTTNITKNAGDITNLKNLSNITDAGKTVIKNLSKDAVQIKAGTAITVDGKVDETTGNKTYIISANNNGKVAKDDGNLISGDTLYKEVHVDSDGSYIKSNNTVGQNLSALDSGLKTTSDLIHTNAKGDTIQIGGNSTATKIDVSGKDKDGNTTGRVITGVMTDGKDLTSAANVGYVNGITSANTQQIYRDMNNAYSRLDTNINRAAAGSNALAALHPLDFDPADKASFAVGYGHYHNANAAAVGAFYQPNANTMVNMGISIGNGDPGFNAGVSFKIGKGSAYNGVSKAEMAQTIHDQAEEISAIKANDAAKDKRIDALEKENQEMKKQIQEILSRLNG
ncbi:YadA-like family protein [Megasphaera sp. DJF_B143]|uniref:YadA-like family protein n=1 Tax=Megasphaera sp. DJF_B143 TaxID=537288 RepID=UPI000AB0117D|nr:YadA-like family protein [Megasphaera sp. DJF_B143]